MSKADSVFTTVFATVASILVANYIWKKYLEPRAVA
jgi:hypothetical protein